MYQLISSTASTRTYQNAQTGTQVTTSLKFTDQDGGQWWVFDDLFAIPAIRKMASQKIASLYGVGVTLEDITTFLEKHKATLKTNDVDKYERAYADVLNFEAIVQQTADPVKQSLALCTVYVLADNESIDLFSMQQAAQKMEEWALKPDVQAFFLTWWMDGINPYIKAFHPTSPTALNPEANPLPAS